tara:strand:- start:13941 stop:15140 length:1200 start_codon:yes stop_codon:yes gene_type:complete
MSDSLSVQQARKLVLHSQQLATATPSGSAIAATLSAIEHLGYIQIDTISAVQRAHHHTLWNRNPHYDATHLDQLLASKQVFEYWSHAAAYLPMRDYRYSLPRKRAIASGEQGHWYEPDKPLMKAVLKRITSEGPLMAKDFEYRGEKLGEWRSKPAKRALECLYMRGDLMISERRNFHKVYELTERVLGPTVNTTAPTTEEYGRFLIKRYLEANGLGQPAEISYLRKNTKPLIATTLRSMLADGELVQLDVGGNQYLALPRAMELLNTPLARNKLAILSPFDNLLIQRKRMQALFDFDYLIECYVPEHKRQYGYFSLPILWNGKLVARMDCKADRRESHLHILHLAVEPSLENIDGLTRALCKKLPSFMQFNRCTQLSLHKASPNNYLAILRTAFAKITP